MRRKPRGSQKQKPYERAIKLSCRDIRDGYSNKPPRADSYSFLEFGVGEGGSLKIMAALTLKWRQRLRVQPAVQIVAFDT